MMDKTIDQLSNFNILKSPIHTKPEAFFKSVYNTFLNAEKVVGESNNCFYKIGGYTIRLRFAGSALVPTITPAFEHLYTKPYPEADLTICLWDSGSTGIKMPTPPWSSNDYVTRGEIKGFNNGRIFTNFQLGSYVLSMLDINLKLAVYWTRDALSLPYYESGAPLLTILHWWMGTQKNQLAHAGAVGTMKGGVLLVGRGGSGKSTTCLSCLTSELLYVSDDYCLLTTEPFPYVHSLYNSAKLNLDSIKMLPHLIPAISNTNRLNSEKALFFLYKHYPEKLATGFPIRAILLPRITARAEARIKEVSSAESLKALAASTIFQLSGAGNKEFHSITKFVKRIPSYTFELGYDTTKVPQMISKLISEC